MVSAPLDEDDVDELLQALVASRPEGLREHRRPLGSFVRDDDGRLVAGIACHTQFGWLCIEKLWVDLAARGRHLGSRLLAAAEREAARRGCEAAWVDTFSFQARPFYEAHGYELFGELTDFPPGHSRYFLRKRLSAE